MVPYLGDYDTTETVRIPFNTFTSDDPAASCTITNLAAGDVEIHKDGSTTQRASDSGVTVAIDFDSITGNHFVIIDLSDNADAGFYASGSRYTVRIEGVTIDGGTVNAWIGSFSIGCMLRPTTAGRKLDVSAGGEAGVDWANVGSPTTTVALTATTINDAQKVDVNTVKTRGVQDYGSGHTYYLGGDNAANGAAGGIAIVGSAMGLGSGVIVSGTFGAGAIDAAAIKDAAIDNATFAADVGSTAYATNIIALAVRKVLDELNLDHLAKVADSDDVVNDSIIGKLASTDGDWSNFAKSTDSLQSIRDKLPTNLEDLNITDTTGLVRPDMANASGNYAGTVGKSPATLAAGDVTGNLPADVKTVETVDATDAIQAAATAALLEVAYEAV